MVNVYLAEGFEEIEALTIVDLLRRAGISVQTVSTGSGLKVTGTHGVTVEADVIFDEADNDSCEMLVLPGGLPGADNLGYVQRLWCWETAVSWKARKQRYIREWKTASPGQNHRAMEQLQTAMS